MLILAGVTISIVINGGLFTQSKEAARQTDIANAEEVLQADLVALQMQERDNPAGITETMIREVVDRAGVLQAGYSVTSSGNTWVLTGKTKKGNDIRSIIIQKKGMGITIGGIPSEPGGETGEFNWRS